MIPPPPLLRLLDVHQRHDGVAASRLANHLPKSRIRDAHQREILAKLSLVPRTLSQDSHYAALATQTGQCVQDLIRMWGD